MFKSTFSFQEGFINSGQSAVALVNHQEQVVVITVAINRHGLSRRGTNQSVDVSAGSNLLSIWV